MTPDIAVMLDGIVEGALRPRLHVFLIAKRSASKESRHFVMHMIRSMSDCAWNYEWNHAKLMAFT
jgi:hypothetical protein